MEGQNPDVPVEVETLPPPEPYYEDNKWFGVPPPGEQPLPDRVSIGGRTIFAGKYSYVFMVVGIIILEIGIWAVYRYTTAPILAGFGTELFYLVHIIAAPTIHIIPILLFWRFFRKERGLPFVFTKKLLMSGVIVGFGGAIIWRFLEEVIYDGVAGAAGGTVPGTFMFVNRMDTLTMTLFALMTFVHFFVVGPVEELEFRGFAQDQAARVLPNLHAVILSSVLFGCSHIPIAVFVYQFPPHIFVVALIGWMSAGAVFGFLYMWSRSIFAVIVMHGMGNWQLSIFYFQSTELIGGMDSFTTVLVGTVSSIIADGIMILIFFLIHKYYWQPHRRGEPAFGGILLKIQDFVHAHDFERKPAMITMVLLISFVMVTCAMLMGVTAAFGETDYSKLSTFTTGDTGGSGSGMLDSFMEEAENITDSGYLDEGTSSVLPTITTEMDRYVKGVKFTLTWTDEPDTQYGLRVYENEPDTFSVKIEGLNSSKSKTESNVHGEQGIISLELEFTNEEIAMLIDEESYVYDVTVEITMDNAGESFTTGLIGFTDSGNDYQYEMEIIWLVPGE
jgi:membrane protease YdiL (CAAX protease family)